VVVGFGATYEPAEVIALSLCSSTWDDLRSVQEDIDAPRLIGGLGVVHMPSRNSFVFISRPAV
jgi:hypothetical protein